MCEIARIKIDVGRPGFERGHKRFAAPSDRKAQMALGAVDHPVRGRGREGWNQKRNKKEEKAPHTGVTLVPGSMRFSTESRRTKWCQSAAPIWSTTNPSAEYANQPW